MSLASDTARAACHMHDRPSGLEDGESVCCLCTDDPCPEVNVARASRHGWSWSWASSVAAENRVAYILNHGHDQLDPWDLTECPPQCCVRKL